MLQLVTTPDPAAEAQRHAYNAAFHELDLSWHWDAATFARVRLEGVRAWIAAEHPHLLRAYALEFLAEAIEQTQARWLAGSYAPAAPQDARLAA
ncbi:hypothetical protein HHL11_16205 [Ramlibacter sp. G-1-2-2]|uniref:Uncharacterized protein n=1 Tax=Ramlibacter agri TaxID=2728837 RepID=A0A848H463_9BURK|nr:hypothetical protein [Ramlibacter agri]NML45297.1 hypothetical protein [Ramlibacter agri]